MGSKSHSKASSLPRRDSNLVGTKPNALELFEEAMGGVEE